MNVRPISFQSQGVACEGDLYLPDGFDPARNYPALVIGHGFATDRTNLIEEGRLFAEAGFIALAIDYRHFGGSGGEPRGRVWPMQECEDFRSAIDWLETQPGVDTDRIGIWGTSFAGGIVTHVAAYDMRVRACVAQAPILDGDAWLRALNREYEYFAIREHLLAERRKRAAGAPAAVHPTMAPSPDGFVPMPVDPVLSEDIARWYERTGQMLMTVAPEVTLETFEKVMEFDATHTARKIAPRAYCIVQMAGRDVYHPNEPIQTAFRAAGEPKRMVSSGWTSSTPISLASARRRSVLPSTFFWSSWPDGQLICKSESSPNHRL